MSDIRPQQIPRKPRQQKPRHESKGMHFTRREPHMCICVEDCCNDAAGCSCKQCPCNNGGPDHDTAHDNPQCSETENAA